MNFPPFFARVPAIRVHDGLAEVLGASADGVLEYNYVDAVRLAGHSCPTVAAAYALACRGMQLLYGDALPERGQVRVDFDQPFEEGVVGVTASVVGLITGSAGAGGFKGVGGHHARRNLQHFASAIAGEMRFTRLDNGNSIDARADLSAVPAAPGTFELLPRCMSGAASDSERREFARLWQQRVERILLEHWDDDTVFQFSRP